MNQVLSKLVMNYLQDVASNIYSQEDLEYMSNKFVEDFNRVKSAIEDFE